MIATATQNEVGLPALWRLYERMDALRAGQGAWLESLGWGPEESPARVVLACPHFRLRAHAAPDAGGPAVLLVPAPIKRAYIWDLAAGASVVRACLGAGLRPYLVEWRPPVPGSGLAEYGDRFLATCVEAIRAEGDGMPPVLAGHSLGGLLAALFAALHAGEVRGVVLLASPLHFSFSRDDGALGPVVEAVEARGLLRSLPGNLPGSVLSQAGFMASPTAFGQERWQDWLRSLAGGEGTRTHMQVARWSLDEMPLAGRLLDDLVGLHRSDGFMRGTLRVGRRSAAAARVAAPLLVVADRQCPVVPPAAILPFYAAAASRDKRLLWYEGDVGVGIRHVGVLVGRNAHARLWPEILAWIRSLR